METGEERQAALPSFRPGWIMASVLLVLVASPTLSSMLPSGTTSVATVVVLIVLCISWVASLIILPLCIAWFTDSRNAARDQIASSAYPRLDLSLAQESMNAILASINRSRTAIHKTSSNVDALIDDVMSLAVRHFIQVWHTPLVTGGSTGEGDAPRASPETKHFPLLVEHTIRMSLVATLEKLQKLDLASLGVSKVLPIVTEHIKAFESAELEWKKSGIAAEIIDDEESEVFLVALYNSGKLHPAVGNIASADTKLTELDHLRKLGARILGEILPPEEAQSKGVSIVVKEIFASTIMKTVVDVMSDPDTLNALLEERASAALQEQKLVSQLREALDRQSPDVVNARNSASSSSAVKVPAKKSRSGDTSFDKLMESIHQSRSILEARRIKSGLLQQIRKTKTAMGNDQTVAEDGRKTQLSIFLQRLQAAMEAVEHRMHQLGSATPNSISEQSSAPSPRPIDENIVEMTLRDILTSSSAIAYFLEFAEMRHRSVFVQFWLSVNTFKYPLELAESDGEDEGATSLSPSLHAADRQEVRMLCEDLRFFVETYYRTSELVEVVGQKQVLTAENFLRAHSRGEMEASTRSVRLARRSVVNAQNSVYEEMLETDWPSFKKTQGWQQAADDLKRERAHEVPTMKASSSTFLESKHNIKTTASRPIANRAASHSHLFGLDESSPEATSPVSNSGLFGDDSDATAVTTSRARIRAQPSLDQLLGGKGSTFDSLHGRTPLFREALFDEDEGEAMKDKEDFTEKETLVQVDKIDAFEDVLASILRADLTQQPELIRPPLGKKKSTSSSVISSGGGRKASDLFETEGKQGTSTPRKGSSPTLDQLEGAIEGHYKEVQPADLARIEQGIKRLRDQEELLGALMRKAELTGTSAKEVRLLEKSKTTIAREMRELVFEMTAVRARLEEQEHLNSRARIEAERTLLEIKHAEVNIDQDGKEFATYLIEVSVYPEEAGRRVEGRDKKDAIAQSGWVVSRRYNEFYLLHSRLKDRFVQVRALDPLFPGKRFAGQISAAFLDSRRISLQKYLQEIGKLDVICKSIEFKTFLSQNILTFSPELLDQAKSAELSSSASPIRGIATSNNGNKGLVSRLYRGVTGVAGGLDDLLFGPSMYEVVVNRLSTGVVDLVGFNEMEKILAGATVSSPAEIKEATQVQNTSFTTPICDVIIELFQLKLEGNWLRRQAVIVVAQQALGGTIERRVRQSIQAALEPLAIQNSIVLVRNLMWPNGKLKQPGPSRSREEKRVRRENALKKLSTLIPTVASHFVGRDNARRAARRTWAMLQSKRLNKHVIYCILDKVIDEVFPPGDK